MQNFDLVLADLKPALYINPDLGLPQIERRNVSAAIQPVTLDGAVSGNDIIAALDGKQYPLIIVSSHGDDSGIRLSNGENWTPELISQDAKAAGAKLLILASCNSETIGRRLAYEIGCIVITCVGNVDDATAARLVTYAIRNLAAGMTIIEAYRKARPAGDRSFRIFPDPSEIPNDMDRETSILLLEQTRAINGRLDALTDEVKDLRRRTDQLGRKMDEQDRKIDDLVSSAAIVATRLHAMTPSTPTRVFAWAIGFVVFCTVGILYLKDVRDLLDLSWSTAFVLIIAGQCTSLLFFAYGLGFIRERSQ